MTDLAPGTPQADGRRTTADPPPDAAEQRTRPDRSRPLRPEPRLGAEVAG
ncbi:hypothetical protein OG455_08825 [Kitasatospora sp. NBC_01287]|nr:hypothetical protein [Kitasatospora sp. NBC_01287]MCX4745622.1 hypothetical protein [Kitasatospora sp. NBC_01287]